MIVELIGWLGTALIMLGYYLNARKYKTCFYVWGLGNIVFFVSLDVFITAISASVRTRPINA